MAGRPRSFNRDEAIDVALDAFWRSGYEQTSIAQLTAAIGIRPPSLYAAFGDKAGLFTEASSRYIERFRRSLDELLDRPTTREAIAALLRGTAAAHTDPATPPGCPVLSEPRLATERRRMRDTIADRLYRGQREGDLPTSFNADELANFYEAVLTGMSDRARDGGTHHDLLAIANLALQVLPDRDENQ